MELFQVLGPMTGPVTANILIGGGGTSSNDGTRTKVSKALIVGIKVGAQKVPLKSLLAPSKKYLYRSCLFK